MKEIVWNVMGYISFIMALYKKDTSYFAIGLSCFILAKLHEDKP